jgi:hypothetical protein
MVSKTDFTISSIESSRRQDAENRLEKLMEELASGRIAARIIEAASLAYAGQMYQRVQEMPSEVESENSTV